MPIDMTDPGIPEYECDECGVKTQEEGCFYYVEDWESETMARMILCPECWNLAVDTKEIVLIPDYSCSGCNE
jgi:hypothetical protein